MRAWAVLALAACSAAVPPSDLARGEQLAHDGNDTEALVAYDAAIAACPSRFCRAALVGKAEVLDHLGRHEEAAQAYEAIPGRLPDDAEGAASALVAAARIRLALGQSARAYDLFWHVVVNAPQTSAADDALRDVVGDGRRRSPRELYATLIRLYERLGGTDVGDNLLWELAVVARDDLHESAAALTAMDRLVSDHKDSPFVDDALYGGALLARASGDAVGAIRRLRELLAKRESSWIVGSYNSQHMPAAQLELGRVLRDDQKKPADALAAFAKVEADYPQSTLVDDALFESAVTQAQTGDGLAACQSLGQLARRFPDSKLGLEKAPDLGRRLGCGR